MTDQPLDLDAEYRDDSLDLLHVDPAPDTDATPCHWTDCPLDAGHDDPHAELAKLVRWHREDETALKKMRATIERLRAELATARNPHTPRLCRCGHSHHAHTVPAPHSCFAYGQTCPCEAYRQLPHDEAMAQLERNRRAAAERERAAAEEAHVVADDSSDPEPYRFVDDDGDYLHIGIPASPACGGPAISFHTATEPVHVPVGQIGGLIAALRRLAAASRP